MVASQAERCACLILVIGLKGDGKRACPFLCPFEPGSRGSHGLHPSGPPHSPVQLPFFLFFSFLSWQLPYNSMQVGTLEYMAPEILLRTAPHGPASDVYALAVTLNEVG